MAAQNDIEIFSGNDVLLECEFTDESSGAPYDLSGAQQLTYALSRKASGTPIISKSLSSGVVMVNPALGLAQVLLNASDTEPLNGTYYHEIRVTNALGKKLTLVYGQVTVLVNLIRN